MKRIRVELEVDESALPAWDRAARGNMEKGPDVWHTQVRSVEVVEPERWTELVLRRDRARDHILVAGDEVSVAGGGHSYWRVVSCTEREEYPNG